MRYTREELIHILGEKELNQIIAECRLKRALNPKEMWIMRNMQIEKGFNHLVALSICRLAFPTLNPPENCTLNHSSSKAVKDYDE